MFCWDEKMTPSPNVHLLVLVTVVTAVCHVITSNWAPGQCQCEATAYVVPVSEQRLECCHWYRLESGVQRCGQQQPARPCPA